MRRGSFSSIILAACMLLPSAVMAVEVCTLKHDWQNNDPSRGLITGYHISGRAPNLPPSVVIEESELPGESMRRSSDLGRLVSSLASMVSTGECIVHIAQCQVDVVQKDVVAKKPTFSIKIGTYPLYVDHLATADAKLTPEQLNPLMSFLQELGVCGKNITLTNQ